MKKSTAIILALAMVFTLGMPISTFGADPDYPKAKVTVNGTAVEWKDMEPVNISGMVFVPVREALEAFGQKVTWSAEAPSVVETDDEVTGLHVKFDLGSAAVETSQLEMERDFEMVSAPKLLNGKTMVPIRALTEIYGKSVAYDTATATVNVSDYRGDDAAAVLESGKTYNGFIGDIVAVHYSTDGTYSYEPAANRDFVYIGSEAEGAGNYRMYFRAMNANSEGAIQINKLENGETVETLTYKAVIADPAKEAAEVSKDGKTTADKGQYVKVTLPEQSGSTGYAWYITACSAGLQQVEKISEVSVSGMPGASNDVVFIFKVLDDSVKTVTFDKLRGWGGESAETVTYTVAPASDR